MIAVVSLVPQSNSDVIIGLVFGLTALFLICIGLIKVYCCKQLPELSKMPNDYTTNDKEQPHKPESMKLSLVDDDFIQLDNALVPLYEPEPELEPEPEVVEAVPLLGINPALISKQIKLQVLPQIDQKSHGIFNQDSRPINPDRELPPLVLITSPCPKSLPKMIKF